MSVILTAYEYTLFSSAQLTFSRIDHMLGHKTCLNKFKKCEVLNNIKNIKNNIKRLFPTTMKWNYISITKGKLENSQMLGNSKPHPWVNSGLEKKSKWKEEYISRQTKAELKDLEKLPVRRRKERGQGDKWEKRRQRKHDAHGILHFWWMLYASQYQRETALIINSIILHHHCPTTTCIMARSPKS